MVITFTCIVVFIALLLAVTLYKNNEKDKEIERLIAEVEDLSGRLPCDTCLICRLTNAPCVGKKNCKIYNGLK